MNAPATLDPALGRDQGAAATVRAFFALVPDAEVRTGFANLARDIARRSRGRAVSGEHVHLTLAFLGDVATASIPLLQEIGGRLPHAGAMLEFDMLGAWRASGVAWIAPSVLPPALPALHGALGSALAEAGFTLEIRPFRPHVTLARRCVQPLPRARTAPIRWRVDCLTLVGSELRPAGPVYRDLASWPLAVPD